MKFCLIISLSLAWGISFLDASDNTHNQQNAIILNPKKNKIDLIKRDWARGYEKGFSDARNARAFNYNDSVAMQKGIPTSEAFQSGYEEGYKQGR